jgi:hypothetical protein
MGLSCCSSYSEDGHFDMNRYYTSDISPFLEIDEYLSDREFIVLSYDKRGTGEIVG